MTFRFIVLVENQVVNDEALKRVHVEKFRLRIEARGHPIGRTLFLRVNQSAVSFWFLVPVRNGLTLGIEPRSQSVGTKGAVSRCSPVVRSSKKKYPFRLACASSLRFLPWNSASNRTGVSTASQSCVSCGEGW